MRQKLSNVSWRKRDAKNTDVATVQIESEGTSNDVNLRQVPSSTSVFRTPSSVITERISLRSLGSIHD